MSTEEKIRREKVASKNLTEYRAHQSIDEEFTGKVGEATVTDVRTEFDDPTMLAEFEIELPDNSVGYLRFSDYSDHLLETFLEEELQTSHAEMNVLMKTFPVVNTQYGWEAKIGDSPLRYVFQDNKDSWMFNVNKIGMPIPNTKIQYGVLILSLLPAINFGLLWIALMALSYIGLGLFLYIPIMVMLSPISRDVRKESVKD